MLNLILLIIFGYFLGSMPWGYLICKVKGVDIRQIGSGATGTTNVIRALGKKFGILVWILDVIKAAIPVYLATIFLFFNWQIALVAISPILGHIFPVWLKFKGGKGVASTFGVLLVLLGWQGFLLLLLTQALVLFTVKVMSFSSLIMACLIPLFVVFFSYSLEFYILGIALASLIWWAHRENIVRMKQGQEPKFKTSKNN